MRIRLNHHMVGAEYVVTSPDVKGLYVVAPTRQKAEEEAVLVMRQLETRKADGGRDLILEAVEYRTA